MQHADRLSEYDRLRLEAVLALVTSAPGRCGAQVSSHSWGVSRRPRGLVPARRNALPLQRRAWAAGCGGAGGLRASARDRSGDFPIRSPHLAGMLLGERRNAEVEELVERYLELSPESTWADFLRGLRGLAVDGSVSDEVLSRLNPMEAVSLLWAAANEMEDLKLAHEIGLRLAGGPWPAEKRSTGNDLAADVLLAMGKWRAAQQELSALRVVAPEIGAGAPRNPGICAFPARVRWRPPGAASRASRLGASGRIARSCTSHDVPATRWDSPSPPSLSTWTRECAPRRR